jgi:hypothetical protein
MLDLPQFHIVLYGILLLFFMSLSKKSKKGEVCGCCSKHLFYDIGTNFTQIVY